MLVGYLYGVLSVLFFGLNGPVTKVILLAGITPIQLAFAREIITAFVAFIALLIFDRGAFRLTKRQFVGMLATGIIAVAGVQFAYSLAIQHLPVGIALLFEYSGVLIVAVFATLVWKEPAKPRLWFALVAVIIGLAVVANFWAASLSVVGILAGSFAAIALAAYFLLGERMLNNSSPTSILFWTMLIAALVWLVPAQPWTIDPATLLAPISLGGTLADVWVPLGLVVVWSAVMGTTLTYWLSYQSIKRLKATPAGVLSVGEVVFAFLFAWLWLGQTLEPIQLAGGALVIVGIVIAQTARREHPLDLTLAPADFETGAVPIVSAANSATAKMPTGSAKAGE